MLQRPTPDRNSIISQINHDCLSLLPNDLRRVRLSRAQGRYPSCDCTRSTRWRDISLWLPGRWLLSSSHNSHSLQCHISSYWSPRSFLRWLSGFAGPSWSLRDRSAAVAKSAFNFQALNLSSKLLPCLVMTRVSMYPRSVR